MSPLIEKLAELEKAMRLQALNNKVALTIEEAAIYTEYTVESLRQLVHKRMIPYSKPSGEKGKTFFEKAKLDEWMLSNPVKTQIELDRDAASYIMRNRKQKI